MSIDTPRTERHPSSPNSMNTRRVSSPRLIELVRVAQLLSGCRVEIVTLHDDHAFIIASLGRNALQPRPLIQSERMLVSSTEDVAATADAATFGVPGLAVGAPTALTLHGCHPAAVTDGLLAIARLIASDEPLPSENTHRDTALLDALRDPVLIIDESFTIRYASAGVALLLGRTPNEMVGQNGAKFVLDEDLHVAHHALNGLVAGRESYRTVVRLIHGSGHPVRIEITASNYAQDATLQGVVLSLRSGDRDIELEDSLQRERSLLAAILDQLHEGVIATDLVGAPTIVNQAARALYGIEHLPTDDVSLSHLTLFDDEHDEVSVSRHPITRVQAGEQLAGEVFQLRTSTGDLRHVVVSGRPVVNALGQQVASALAYHDATMSHRAERQLHDDAHRDPLTGLGNRKRLIDQLSNLASSPADVLVGVCFVDLDGFKLVNDTFGHAVGDEVLRMAARRLSAELRPSDLLARYGGDEFIAVLVGSSDASSVFAIAERLRRTIERPFVIDGSVVTLSASMGLALTQSTLLDPSALLRSADVALYSAKASGKNRVEIFDNNLASAAIDQRAQLTFLKSVLDADAITVVFQPAIEIATGRIVGVEALARLRKPDGTLVGPAPYLKVATASGLVRKLDALVLERTCEAAARFREERPDLHLLLSCNFSGLSVAQAGFAGDFLAALRRHGLRPPQVNVEIAESTAFELSVSAKASLHKLTEAGVLLILDDFGTGYGSIVRLRELPLAAVKLDRSFLRELRPTSAEISVALALVRLTQTITPIVVAEGLETDEDVRRATEIGFTIAQGHHFLPPVPIDEFLAYLPAAI